MSILLETNLGGDIVIDLDVEGSPLLCKNLLKLAKLRYYTSCLVYNVQSHRFFQTGDPTGTGQGGACIYGVLDRSSSGGDAASSQKRFLKSTTSGRRLTPSECRERGRVVAMDLNHTKDTIGSQFLITLGKDCPGDALDGYLIGDEGSAPLSLGVVAEDDDGILDQIEASYCDTDGRPYADIRISRMLVLHDPFPDPPGFWEYLKDQPGILIENEKVVASPDRSKPPQEAVPERIPVNEFDPGGEETEEQIRQRKEEDSRQEAHQRAVVLELLGDLPDADYKAPEHVLFVCKLNAITQDEDLELIFSRFDPNCKAEIIRDLETGNSLQYAFVEFSSKNQCVEAYFKMNNALVDDRRIKVDFSQSVAKLWDKHTQRLKARSANATTAPSHPARESTQHRSRNSHRPNHEQHASPQRRHLPPPPRRRRNDDARDEFGRSSRQSTDDPSRRRHDSSDPRSRHQRTSGEIPNSMSDEHDRSRDRHRDKVGDRMGGRSYPSDDDGGDRRRDGHDRGYRKHDRGDENDDSLKSRRKKHKRHHQRHDSEDRSHDSRREEQHDSSRRHRDFRSSRRSGSQEADGREEQHDSSRRNRDFGSSRRSGSQEADDRNRKHRHQKIGNTDGDNEGRFGDDTAMDVRHRRRERSADDGAVEDKRRRLSGEGSSSEDDDFRRRKHKRRSEERGESKRRKKEKRRHRDESGLDQRRQRRERESSDDDERRYRDR